MGLNMKEAFILVGKAAKELLETLEHNSIKQEEPTEKTCKWSFKEDMYVSECGHNFMFFDEEDNLNTYDYKNCPYCGGTIKKAKGKNTQNKRIKKHLENGGSLTQLEALKMFGTMRLASRINDLKNEGMNISKVMEEHNGKRYARYFKVQIENKL